MRLTIRDIEKLQNQGKIKGYSYAKPRAKAYGRKQSKHFPKRSKEKNWMSWNLLYFCNQHALQLLEEYRFDTAGRKWRLDWYIPAIKTGIEYNGIMSAKSRHTTITGYTGDMNKLNAAQQQGIRVLQFTPLNYKQLLTELNKLVQNVRTI